MGFFSNLFKGPSRPTPAERVPALAELTAACATDPRPIWPAFYAGLRGKWDLRIDAVVAFTEMYLQKQKAAQRQPLIDALVAADPASWTMARAHYYLELAYEARGGGPKIKDENTFRRCIEAAMPDINAAMKLDASDPSPCVTGLTFARIGGGDEEALYAEGTRRAPDCYALHREFNNCLSQRWGGSHAAQLDHARKVAANSPEASLGVGLPINALYFHLSHILIFDKDRNAMAAFAQDPGVLEEVRASAERSVANARHLISAATFDLRTRAALIVMSGGDVDYTRRLFPLIGDVYIDNPWRQLNEDPQPMFDMYKKMYGGG